VRGRRGQQPARRARGLPDARPTTGRPAGSPARSRARSAELFIARELLAAGGRAVIEVILHEPAHARAAVRGIKDTSAEGNRYHNKRFGALAAELELRGPAGRPGPGRANLSQ
jgi:hypothetical protein